MEIYKNMPENERSPDLKRKKKSAQEAGYFRESLYSPGEYERKDRWGDVVSHQDGKSSPSRNIHGYMEGEYE